MPQSGSTSNKNAYDARTVGDWWLYNSTTRGLPRMLAPDFHTWDEPLELNLYTQRKFPAYGMAWMDGKGWGRYLNAQPKNSARRSMIGFDSSQWPDGTPAIKLTGCRAIELSGVNLFRSTPGVLTYDTNAVGQNSAGIVFRNVGFGTRYDGDPGYDDPYDGLGLIVQNPTNRLGYFGHATEGTNGTDSAEFYDVEFFYLQAPIASWSPQTTRLKFDGSFFRWCDESYHGDESPNEIGEASGSGNILCKNCSWRDVGPFVYKAVKSALSNLAIIGGWYETGDGVARTFLDCSEHTGVCNFTWSGVKAKPFTSGTAPFVKRKVANPRDTKLHSVDIAALPGGAPFYGTFTPRASMLSSYLLEKASDPTVADDDLSATGLRSLYLNTTTGQAGVAIHNGSTLSLCRGESLLETITEDGALQINGPSAIDASGEAVAATLGDGTYIGQRKTVYCSNADNAVTVTVAKHEDGDNTVVAMDVGESLSLEWTGLWVDLRAVTPVEVSGMATVANVAALASLVGLSDGDAVQTLGCQTAGDGGHQVLRYHSSGRSGVTTTTYGWYINGPGADDYFEAIDKSVANVRQFGAKGDLVTDDTAAFEAAREASQAFLENGQQNYKTIFVPTGRYAINFKLAYGDAVLDSISIRGDGAGTKIFSYADGEFAITCEDEEFARAPYFWNTIEDITFVGKYGATDRRCGGIASTSHIRLVNVRFDKCAVGLACSTSFYSSWTSLSFSDCDVGILNGAYYTDGGNDAITGLIDGDDAAHSMTFPGVGADSSSSYSGNRLMQDIRFNGCRIGFAAIGNSEANLRRSIINKGTWEGCEVAILMDEGSLELNKPWFESNDSGSTTSFMGETLDQGDVTFVDPITNDGNYGARVVVNGGKGPNVVNHATRSVLILDDATDVTGSTIHAQTVAREIRSSNGFNTLIEKPHQNLVGTETAITCLVLPKVLRVPHQPPNGRVILAATFEGASLPSPLVLSGATATYEVADGVWDSNKCMELSTDANPEGFRFPSTPYAEFQVDKVYTAVLACKHEFNGIFAGNGIDVFVGDPIQLASEKWTWIGMVGGGEVTTSGAPFFRFQLDAGESTPQYVRVSALQIIEWDNEQAAADYMATPYFYEEEGV